MNIFSFITMAGGLAFFLYGMNVMSTGLEKMTGGKLEAALNKLTKKPISGLMLGMGITVAIQSSSALTVMLVGLVNSGVMHFDQTVFILMGSNIGTTLTAWILSLSGLDSSNVMLKLLKPTSFSPIMALVGVIMIFAAKSNRKKDIGSVMVGFSVLMYGMTLMSDAVAPLADVPEFAGMLTAFNNPIIGVLVGTIFTGIIQSSAASVGILQALSLTGGISFQMAAPIIMGQNIGTCVTSVLSGIGVSKNAKRVSVMHVLFNVIGTVICLIAFYIVKLAFNPSIFYEAITPAGIAAVHSLFNVTTTLLLLPFSKLLVKGALSLIPGAEGKTEKSLIDERLLATPAFAVSECGKYISEMAVYAKEAIISACSLLNIFSEAEVRRVSEKEDLTDFYEDKLGDFLVKLSAKELTDEDSVRTAQMLHEIGDLERLGDHAMNLMEAAQEKNEKDVEFSDQANEDLNVIIFALKEILDTSLEAVSLNSTDRAVLVEPLEQRIDELVYEAKSRHIQRLRLGECTIEHGFILSDILANIERISDHCSNLAVAVIEAESSNFEGHKYIEGVSGGNNEQFRSLYKQYARKYKLSD